MAVKVGSAKIDENGKIHGGRAGDQTGREVSTQAWYKHKKGWRVLRCKSADKAEKIARAMQAACDNVNIGYDQYQRLSLYNFAKSVGFDPSRIKTPCETDCSALVRVCLAYAGILVENFRTPNEASVLLRSGEFIELKEGRYTDQSTYLRRGDILVTRTQGHTVVVLSNGSKAEAPTNEDAPRTILKRGMRGEDVRALQQLLIKRGYALPTSSADGTYGAETENAVRQFQTDQGLESDGEYGPLTRAALTAETDASRTILKRGMRGEDVRALQQLLIKRGYVLPESGANGTYGAETERAVRQFQTDQGLKSDGEYGPLTRAALTAEVETPRTIQILRPTTIHAGNGEAYALLQAAAPNTTYPYVATSKNGWLAVALPDRVGWLPESATRKD